MGHSATKGHCNISLCKWLKLFPVVKHVSLRDFSLPCRVCLWCAGRSWVPRTCQLCPWHSLRQERWPAALVHQPCPRLRERACKSFLSLPCERAFFLLGEGGVESRGLPGCSLVPEPNPFVRAPQQETCGTSSVCQTFYLYSIRDLHGEMLSAGSCAGNTTWTLFQKTLNFSHS